MLSQPASAATPDPRPSLSTAAERSVGSIPPPFSVGQPEAERAWEHQAPELSNHPQRLLIDRSIATLMRIAGSGADGEDWGLISGTLQDIQQALQMFEQHRRTRKVTVFGSARTVPGTACYRLSEELAGRAIAAGFDVITGAGAGVMEAANRGAGSEHGFGLNVQLPFEQQPNPYIAGRSDRLVDFRYFFTRKLFFLRECDALVVLPGGFGTLDELFESLTLIQTGRIAPIPVVLLAPPGDPFWTNWQHTVRHDLIDRGLVSEADAALFCEASSAAEAMAQICRFYRVFHTARLVDDRLELLLHAPLTPAQLAVLNQRFADLLDSGQIEHDEVCDLSDQLRPSLRFDFNDRKVGRLYQLIEHLNGLDIQGAPEPHHPEQRRCTFTS